ncbi:peroxiredoxin [Chitinophaga sp. S165]|uniref:peroxiredoxin family protein n=1 Tax=Chitinophaga sp. S165 TaxID=2135462 RepID=UPI000D715ECB|nr:redoxin domain-containing protein [Chitinophaga sp. S165]PWV47106.1 AhpC/TSA family protein [Chitinophaga sp. S165]
MKKQISLKKESRVTSSSLIDSHLFILKFAAVLIFAVTSCKNSVLKKDAALPHFAVDGIFQSQDTAKVTSIEFNNGHPLVMMYFNPDCPSCNKETQNIIANMSMLSDIKFLFVTSSPLEDVKRFEQQYKLKQFPNVKYAHDSKLEIYSLYKIRAIPFMAVYNRELKLSKVIIGDIDASIIKSFALQI